MAIRMWSGVAGVIYTAGGGVPRAPAIAATADGGFMIMATVTATQSVTRRIDPNGSDTLNVYPFFQNDASLAGMADGSFVLAAGTGDVYGYRVQQSTQYAGFNIAATGVNEFDPEIDRHQGGYVMVWNHESDIYARHFDNNNNPTDATSKAISTAAGLQKTPDVASLGNNYVVVWDDEPSNTIRARLVDFIGNPGIEFMVAGAPSFDFSEPAVTALSGGRFVVTWQSNQAGWPNEASGSYHVHAQIFQGSNPVGAAILVNTDTIGDQKQPAITAMKNGGFAVAYMGNTDIYVQMFFADGSRHGSETVINTRFTGVQENPSLAELSDGRLVVAWQDTTLGESHYRVLDPREGEVSGTPLGESLHGNKDLADIILAGDGNDLLFGLGGNDTLNGQAGFDSAVYSLPASEYQVRSFPFATIFETVVIHQGGLATDGTDTLIHMEGVSLGNGFQLLFDGRGLNDLANVAGSRFDDVLIQHSGNGQVLYGRMHDGVFQEWKTITGVMSTDWKTVGTGDVNPTFSLGRAETFIQQQSTGSIYYVSLDTGGPTWGVVSVALTPDWKLRAVADVNGDTSVDAIVQNQVTGTVYYANMRGGTFQGWGVVSNNLSSDWVVVGAADIQTNLVGSPTIARDGFADVIVQQQSTGTTLFANMAGGQFSGWGVVTQNLSPAWKAKGAGDFTGDGRPEFIFQNAAENGKTLYADISQSAVKWGVVTQSVSANWVVEAVADVDNDLVADVVFQNKANGATLYAEPNQLAAGVPSWGVVNTSLTADWHVV